MKKTFLILATLLLLGTAQAHNKNIPHYGNVAPAEIIRLEVKIINKNVQLTWTADSNEEIKSFEIERADDGQTYKTVGGRLAKFVMGNAVYEFVDALPKKNTELLYRIKAIGKGGDYTYSVIKPISIDEGRLFCKLKENPIHTSINLEVVYEAARNLQLTIYSIGGEKIKTLTTRINAGLTVVSIPAQNLLAGIYRLALETGGERKVFSFVKE